MSKVITFQDVIGPSMIGPSSSHTAGACRIGGLARTIYGKEPKDVRLFLHGSFAKTYRGHGTDRALLGGLLGMETDDPHIATALSIAEQSGLKYVFLECDLGPVHPNTVRIEFLENGVPVCSVTGSSIGGGQVRIVGVDGIDTNFDGHFWTLIISYPDRPNMIYDVTSLITEYNLNIATMHVTRVDNVATLIAEVDSPIPADCAERLSKISGVRNSCVVPSLF